MGAGSGAACCQPVKLGLAKWARQASHLRKQLRQRCRLERSRHAQYNAGTAHLQAIGAEQAVVGPQEATLIVAPGLDLKDTGMPGRWVVVWRQ